MATYKGAGVDLEAGARAVDLIRPLAALTRGPQVLAGVGPFSGVFALDRERYREPVLVASTDGVGTKLLLASAHGRHALVGSDLVHHCVNDVLTAGADPLFFLDYVAAGVLKPAVVAEIVSGMVEACHNVGCALLGGETAELPSLYAQGVYDVAGFLVGACERADLIDPTRIEAGDVLLGLPSSGLHTNGYSLARQVVSGSELRDPLTSGRSVLDALLQPHRCYLEEIRALRRTVQVKGLAHITGGGLPGNLPRILPPGLGAVLQRGSWPEPEIFAYLARSIDSDEMWRVFNMGLGMVVVVAAAEAPVALHALGTDVFEVGEVVSSPEQRIQLLG